MSVDQSSDDPIFDIPEFKFDTFSEIDQLIAQFQELNKEFDSHQGKFTAALQLDSAVIQEMDQYILNSLPQMRFQQSQLKGVSYSYSSVNPERLDKFNLSYDIDLPANQSGWFYQSDDIRNQFIVFYFDQPVQIDYYFLMTYPLPSDYSHLKNWRVVTIRSSTFFNKDEIDIKTLSIEILDTRETNELNDGNKVCGFPLDQKPIVNNVVFQMVGENFAGDHRLTIQNLFFSFTPIV